MPKKLPPVVTREETEKPQGIIVNTIQVLATDRSIKDIRDWRNAHRTAESPFLPNRSRLLDLYDDVMLDGHLTGVIEKRIDAVLNKLLHYEVNGKKVDEMDAVIESSVFREIVTKRIEAKLYGLSGMEFIPGEELCFDEIPRKHIKPELGLITTEQSGQTGYEYKNIENVIVFAKKGDLGLLLKCAPYAIYKRGELADWAQYIEIFGQPIRVIKYDAYDTKTKEELRQVLNESGGALAMMVPKQADFEMMDGKATNADGKLQETFRQAMNEEMSVIILGNTETTTSSTSSGYAQSKEHGNQQLEKTKSDLKDVANFLNSKAFFKILKSYSLAVAPGGKFKFEKEINVDELKTKKDIDIAVSAKVPVADDYFYETYGIPKPDNYDELRKKMDDEKKLQTQPGQQPFDKGKGNKQRNPKPARMQLSAWSKIREALADFFAPAQR